MRFGTLLVDPPWAYDRTSRHTKLSGYADVEYATLSTEDLAALPVRDLAADRCVLLLWATWPFLEDALDVMRSWEFEYVTGLPWVKVQKTDPFAPIYGVGYWFRGCTEALLLGRRPGTPSVRTNMTGILSESLRHSRKPASVYELAEKFEGPHLEVFARAPAPGWYALGNECPGDGQDIRRRLSNMKELDWEQHFMRAEVTGMRDFRTWLREETCPRGASPTAVPCVFHDRVSGRRLVLYFVSDPKRVTDGQTELMVSFVRDGDTVLAVVDPLSDVPRPQHMMNDDEVIEYALVPDTMAFTYAWQKTTVRGLNEFVSGFYGRG